MVVCGHVCACTHVHVCMCVCKGLQLMSSAFHDYFLPHMLVKALLNQETRDLLPLPPILGLHVGHLTHLAFLCMLGSRTLVLTLAYLGSKLDLTGVMDGLFRQVRYC